MPKISVIVPVYNVEKYLRRCIDSILNQTFTDFELILVDDGSPDRCPAICDEYALKDNRIRVIHKQNGGLSSARNAGIDIAQGVYLFFSDSDDVIHPDTLRILLVTAEKRQSQITMGLITRFSDDAELNFKTYSAEECCSEQSSSIQIQSRFFDIKNAYQYVSSCCKLYHRNLFDNLRFPVGKFFEDEYVVYKLMFFSKSVVIIPVVLYFYFINSSGITATLSLKKRLDSFQALYEKIHFWEEYNQIELCRKAIFSYLQSVQWFLLNKKNYIEDIESLYVLQKQYAQVWKLAKRKKILNIKEHFDYYMAANPKLSICYRMVMFYYNHLQF